MSAPLKLTADQLEEVAQALRGLSDVRNNHGVELGGWGGRMEIRHLEADAVLELKWDGVTAEYCIDDQVGS